MSAAWPDVGKLHKAWRKGGHDKHNKGTHFKMQAKLPTSGETKSLPPIRTRKIVSPMALG